MREDNCYPIKIKIIGLIEIEGIFCTLPHPKLEVCVKAFGIELGCIKGNPTNGIELSVNLILIKGKLRFYLKSEGNQTCLFVDFDLTLILTGIRYHGTAKIFCY